MAFSGGGTGATERPSGSLTFTTFFLTARPVSGSSPVATSGVQYAFNFFHSAGWLGETKRIGVCRTEPDFGSCHSKAALSWARVAIVETRRTRPAARGAGQHREFMG